MPSSPTPIGVIANRQKIDAKAAKTLRRALAAQGWDDVPWVSIDRGSDGKPAAKKLRKAGVRTVLVAGGDGTVRAAAEALVETDVALAVLPVGTANLFATAFRIPSAASDVVDLIAGGHQRTIDTGTCNGKTFAVMAGAGLDAGMIDDADEAKERLGTLAYLRAGFHEARTREPFAAKVSVDGSLFFEGEATCILVGNTGTLKGGVQAFPDGSVTDGKLDIGVVTAAGMREWAALMVAAVRHKQRTSAYAHLGQGTSIDVHLDIKHRYELDGGMKGRTKRLRFGVQPSSLTICAPPPEPEEPDQQDPAAGG